MTFENEKDEGKNKVLSRVVANVVVDWALHRTKVVTTVLRKLLFGRMLNIMIQKTYDPGPHF